MKKRSGPKAAGHRHLRADRDRSTGSTVLGELRIAGRPLEIDELARRLGLRGKSGRARLDRELDQLTQRGEILRNRRGELCLRERLPVVIGTVSGHRDGHGLVIPEDLSAPVFLPPRQMREVMHGDRVAVRTTGTDRRGRPEGVVVEVLERGTHEVVGRLYEEEGIGFVVPDNPRVAHRVLVPHSHRAGARPGQVVLLRIVEQPSRTAQPLGHVTRVLGDHGAPGMETEIAIHSHGLPFEFPRKVSAEAAHLGTSVSAAARRGREDLRSLPLVTIDGEDARDFDDAVYAERVRGGWRLLVAIADVAHYVGSGSALDHEALNRGTSVYFPNRVLPMLPEALSNGLCSLKPDVDRLCLACEMRISAHGKVTRSRFFEAVIHSAARLTYTDVAAYLARPETGYSDRIGALGPHLDALSELYRALHRARRERGALDFDTPEIKARFDEEGRIAALVEYGRNDAHRLIEECMIAANVEAAKFLQKHRIPTLFRVHGRPEEDRLQKLRDFLAGFGITLPRAGDELAPGDLAAILERIADAEEARLIETVVVRSLPQAVYQPENIGHFGLALPQYTHFTSPIRRYPDLVVHRGLRHVLNGGAAEEFAPAEAMKPLGHECSTKERRADEATRDAMSWLKCEYMIDKIGEEFDALVTGVVDFGLFVQLRGLQVDGLVHVSALGLDYFNRDESGFRLVGARSGRVYRLGDHLRVRLVNVIIDERKIDFELADRAEGAARRTSRGPRRRSRER